MTDAPAIPYANGSSWWTGVPAMGGASLRKLVGQKSPADGKHGEN